MAEYSTQFKAIRDLEDSEKRSAANIYLAHYDGTSEEIFFADLEDKSEILLLYSNQTLVGFTTLLFYDFDWDGNPVNILYSGDTVVDQNHWGQQALAFAWISRLGELKREKKDTPMYWFLLVKGHRTYRYLPAFTTSFYPCRNHARHDLKPLLDKLAYAKFGDDYESANGIVAFKSSRGHLKNHIALPTTEELNKEAVNYFIEKNPNYTHGDELVCIWEVTENSMKPFTKRIFNKTYYG